MVRTEARPSWLTIAPEVDEALVQGRPVVALESSLIAQGLPWPDNLATARQAEVAIREQGAVPATIAVLAGVAAIGLTDPQLAALAQPGAGVRKLSRRDLASAIARQQTGATTVASTLVLAHRAGIRVFATGGIGGVHRQGPPWDVSADLLELSRTPVAVVCAGAKSILDIPQTLELLETLGVPVVGFGTDDFPGFYLRSTGQGVSARVDTPAAAALLLHAHWQLEGAGVVLAQPLAEADSLAPDLFQLALTKAEERAHAAGVSGGAVTPFLLRQLAELTDGKTLAANKALVLANARLGAAIACALTARDSVPRS